MKNKQFHPRCRLDSLDGLRLQTTPSTTTHTTGRTIKPLLCASFAGLIALGLLFVNATAANAQSTAFTYQGRLSDQGAPANGAYDFQFSLYDAPTNGNHLGSTLTGTGVGVTNGLFTEMLDFGSSIFTGADRWLQIGVQTNGGTNFSLLSPRQPLTPAPYAIYAATAGKVPAGAISTAQIAVNAVGPANLQSNAVTGTKIAAGQVVKSLNGLRDDVILAPGTGLSLNTSGNVLQLSANVGNYWNVQGNGGTSGANFLGTLDNQPLELRVNNTRALRLEPNAASPNLIGGFAGNTVSAGVRGSTISGGGSSGSANTVAANYDVIGGGLGNVIQSGTVYGTVGGGLNNRIATNANDSVIAGGAFSVINAAAIDSVISGGWVNVIGSNSYSGVIGGGSFNTIGANAAAGTIAGGRSSIISTNAYAATISGGLSHIINAPQATIGGGAGNLIQTYATDATIGGGAANVIGANSYSSTISGGDMSAIGSDSAAATIAGGWQNNIAPNARGSTISGGAFSVINAAAIDSVISGGWVNVIGSNSFSGVIGGGSFNTIGANAAAGSIAGGRDNSITANAYRSSIGGGISNTNSSPQATIGGGVGNTILTNANGATISGGVYNTSGGSQSTIAGGWQNNIGSGQATIGGGGVNTIGTNAVDSTIAGGAQNRIGSGSFSSTIGGGEAGSIGTNSPASVIGGGWQNIIGANVNSTTIGGGNRNTNSSWHGTIGGGANNLIQTNASDATIAGGYGNMASGPYSSIPGGFNNAAASYYSFAAGRRAKANHQGAFVWADSTDADVASTANNQFAVRASGGVLFYSDPTAAFGAYLPPGGGAFSSLSDRNAKTNNATVDGRDVLERLAAIPIATWNYRSQPATVHHIGPMAQDFARAFGVGEDDKHISTVDADGVALAAIQGLNLKLQDELKKRDAENAQLKVRLDTLERMLNQITRN